MKLKNQIHNLFPGSQGSLASDRLAACRAIEASIHREQSILFGVDLFHECLRCLHEGNAELLKTCHDELLAAVLYGKESLRQSEIFLAETRRGNVSPREAAEFRLDVLKGCPDGERLRRRAEALLKAYRVLFPSRPENAPLNRQEIMTLLDAAAL